VLCRHCVYLLLKEAEERHTSEEREGATRGVSNSNTYTIPPESVLTWMHQNAAHVHDRMQKLA